MRRRLVLVSGAPGSGKTTLAAPLAGALRYPLFSKDYLKETLVRALGGGGDLSTTRKLGAAAMETMWMLAAHAPQAVLEANFRPRSDYERGKLASLDADIVEVYCDCGPDEAARRFAARASSEGHDRSTHPLTALTPELLAEYDRPVGLGDLLRVDTRHPVDIQGVARWVEAAMNGSGG